MSLQEEIANCHLCAAQFAATHSQHRPRPVPWFRGSAQILIAGQAPGIKVHVSGKPFEDRSGDRLRQWLGISTDQFYDRDRVAIVPAAFCFPGTDAKGSDLPPPRRCAETWQSRVLQSLPNIKLRILVGSYAQKNHGFVKANLTETVRNWRAFAPATFMLPHPSWRNSGWLKRHPWFGEELLPELRHSVAELLSSPPAAQCSAVTADF